MRLQASSHITNSQRVRCRLGGLLNVEVYQSEEGPDSKVWRYRGTICWCGSRVRSTGQWVKGLLPSRLPRLPLNGAFYLQLSQLRNMSHQWLHCFKNIITQKYNYTRKADCETLIVFILSIHILTQETLKHSHNYNELKSSREITREK